MESWRIYKQDPNSLVSIEKAFWKITDVISYEELVNVCRTELVRVQPNFSRIAVASDRACRGYMAPDVMDWFSCFLNAKFDSGRPRLDDGFNNMTSRNCSVTSIRSKLKALLLNRPPGSRQLSEDTITELVVELCPPYALKLHAYFCTFELSLKRKT